MSWRRSLTLDARARRTEAGLRVDVTLTVGNVGHRVPTGFPDRQLILAVSADAGEGGALQGPVLPDAVGGQLAGKPGRLYAKLLRDFDGVGPVPMWRADPGGVVDTRLLPGTSDANAWVFPPAVRSVRVRLLHRRFWQAVADEKRWTGNETVIAERTVP